MIPQIISIRTKQLYRVLSDIGLFRVLFVLIMVGLVLIAAFSQLQRENGYWTVVFQLLVIFAIHLKRKDKRFLRMITTKQTLIYIAEYVFFSLPFLLFSILFLKFDLLLYQLAGIAAISFANISLPDIRLNFNNVVIRMIPDDLFEIKSGVRKYFLWLILIYTAALGLSFSVGTIPIALFVITSIFISFYQFGESRNILEAKELSVEKFLRYKILTHCKFLFLIQLPLSVLYIILHYQYFWIVLILMFFAQIVLLFAIVLKYAAYEPNSNLSGNTVFNTIAQASMLVPFLFPVIIILAVVYYFRASDNLNNYLDAYN